MSDADAADLAERDAVIADKREMTIKRQKDVGFRKYWAPFVICNSACMVDIEIQMRKVV